ncbi:MAG: LysM peptidoglycan-binding domain-containing protein [Pseudomonadota bacterium]
MTGTFTARAALLLLAAVIALGAGLLWWLLNHPEFATTLPDRPKPPVQAEKSAPAETPASKPLTSASETIKDLGTQLGVSKPAATESGPQFDVARIEPNGDSVIAGRARPNATVELLRDGEVHDRTVADATGSFVLIPKPLPPGKYELKLRMTEAGGKPMVSSQSVAVELGSPVQDKAVAVLSPGTAAPGAPQVPVRPSDAPSAAQPKPVPQTEANVRIDLAEAQEGGKLFISGRSTPGASVRLYLNDSYIATGTASADGQISFLIGSGVRPGEYRIRLDQIGASEKVVARAEVPFSAPATLASSAPPASPAPTSSAPQMSIAAAQPQAAAPAPQPSAPASPAVTADRQPQTQAQAQRPAAPLGATETKPAISQRAAPEPRIAAAETAPRASDQAPAQPGSVKPAEPQSKPASHVSQGETAPREAATAAKSPAPSTPSPPSAGATHDSRAKSAAATDRSGTVVVPKIDTRVVIRGDNLWQISRATYGQGIRYTVIYKANRDQIRDPDLIYPGQIFVLPKQQR